MKPHALSRQSSLAFPNPALDAKQTSQPGGPFQLKRLGIIMEPQTDNPHEAEGVLNPACARGTDGALYLFPRLVAKGNFSRIGIARVLFDTRGEPYAVERMGVVLEPQEDYELAGNGAGGCEDPRISYVEPLGYYVMTYTALSAEGPRIALATSKDLLHWDRLGLARFQPADIGVDFDQVDNKDACVFPVAVPDIYGRPSMAILHRPLLPGTRPEETVREKIPRHVDIHRESIWISYCPLDSCEFKNLCEFTSHHRLASPVAEWERLKIGLGTPPAFSPFGWLLIYHGVCEQMDAHQEVKLQYSAGAMVLAIEHPRFIRYRSAQPVLIPELLQERQGSVDNVVFPTAVDRRDDIGNPGRMDVYYGMADNRIGVARMDLPRLLPQGGHPDSQPEDL